MAKGHFLVGECPPPGGLYFKLTRTMWILCKEDVPVASFINAPAGRALACSAGIDAAKMWMYDGVSFYGPKKEIKKLVQWWPGIPAAATDNYIPMK